MDIQIAHGLSQYDRVDQIMEAIGFTIIIPLWILTGLVARRWYKSLDFEKRGWDKDITALFTALVAGGAPVLFLLIVLSAVDAAWVALL